MKHSLKARLRLFHNGLVWLLFWVLLAVIILCIAWFKGVFTLDQIF